MEFVDETKKYAACEILCEIKIIDIRDINILCNYITVLTSMLRYLIQLSIVLILIINVDTDY